MSDIVDPILGRLTLAPRFGWYESELRPVRFLGGQQCRFVIEDYDTDEGHRAEIRRGVQNALNGGAEILNDAERYVVQYCQEMLVRYPMEHRPDVRVETASDVWGYVTFGRDIHVNRRSDGDSEDGVYFSLECECAWEIEHGMQLVLRDGRSITKVGPYDGHLTNADAYADRKLVGVVYVPSPTASPLRGSQRNVVGQGTRPSLGGTRLVTTATHLLKRGLARVRLGGGAHYFLDSNHAAVVSTRHR